jgi:mannose-6-phosphate isomerase class I
VCDVLCVLCVWELMIDAPRMHQVKLKAKEATWGSEVHEFISKKAAEVQQAADGLLIAYANARYEDVDTVDGIKAAAENLKSKTAEARPCNNTSHSPTPRRGEWVS